MATEKLIEAVHRFRCLWNVKDCGYKDKSEKMPEKKFQLK